MQYLHVEGRTGVDVHVHNVETTTPGAGAGAGAGATIRIAGDIDSEAFVREISFEIPRSGVAGVFELVHAACGR